jgi:hypothetical protein
MPGPSWQAATSAFVFVPALLGPTVWIAWKLSTAWDWPDLGVAAASAAFMLSVPLAFRAFLVSMRKAAIAEEAEVSSRPSAIVVPYLHYRVRLPVIGHRFS